RVPGFIDGVELPNCIVSPLPIVAVVDWLSVIRTVVLTGTAAVTVVPEGIAPDVDKSVTTMPAVMPAALPFTVTVVLGAVVLALAGRVSGPNGVQLPLALALIPEYGSVTG